MKLTGTPRRFVFMPGRPAPNLTGEFIGMDAHGGLYVLRWEPRHPCWIAIGFETAADRAERNWPHLIALKGEHANFIVSHACGPEITTGSAMAATPPEGGA